MQQFNMKQKEKYKETELGLLPESWKVVKVSSICKTQAGGTPSTFKEEYWNGDIPWINSGALKNVVIKTPSKFITKLGLDNSNTKLWPKNTVVIALTGATTGMVGLLNFNCSANQSVVGILPNEKFDSFYLFYNLVYSRERVLGFCSGAAQPHINKGIVDDFITLLPPITEQNKISYILSTIQEAKEKTENVINSLKELKKSMMKHLFTYGPVSFKEAKNIKLKDTDIGKLPEEWMIKELKEVAKSRKETINPSEVENKVYVGLEHMSPESIKLLNYGSSSEVRSTKNIFYHGDILYGKLRPYLNKVILSDRKGLSSTDIIIIIAGNINRKYLVYFMKSKAFLEYAISTMTGVNHPRTSWNKLRSFKIPLPSLPIQQKIALVISTIDLKIQKEENKKRTLEELFKSMLHDLITAKIRVNNLEI